MNIMKRSITVIVAAVSLTLVGAVGAAPAANAKDYYCC